MREGIRAGNGVLRAVGSTRAAVDQAAAQQRPWDTPGIPLGYPWDTPGIPLGYPWCAVCRGFVAQRMIRRAMEDDQETMIRWGVQGGHTVNARGRVACMRMCIHVWRLTLMIADSIRSWWRAASAGRD